MQNPYPFFFTGGNICVISYSVPQPLTEVKHPTRSEEEETSSDQFANKLLPLNGPSLPGAIMMAVCPFPSSAHHVV